MPPEHDDRADQRLAGAHLSLWMDAADSSLGLNAAKIDADAVARRTVTRRQGPA